MPLSRPSKAEPEVLSPDQQLRLTAWQTEQSDQDAQLVKLENLAKLMDARFNLPFLPMPIGLDTIVGLVPGIGDTISLAVAGSIVAGTRRLGVPKHLLAAMCANIFVDWLIGLIPIIGDLFDMGWQGNMKNVHIARRYLEAHWEEERQAVLREGPEPQ